MARRRELYQLEHPETKQGGLPGQAGGGKAKTANFAVFDPPAFDKKMAETTGVSERAIRRDGRRGEARGGKDAARIAGTCAYMHEKPGGSSWHNHRARVAADPDPWLVMTKFHELHYDRSIPLMIDQLTEREEQKPGAVAGLM